MFVPHAAQTNRSRNPHRPMSRPEMRWQGSNGMEKEETRVAHAVH